MAAASRAAGAGLLRLLQWPASAWAAAAVAAPRRPMSILSKQFPRDVRAAFVESAPPRRLPVEQAAGAEGDAPTPIHRVRRTPRPYQEPAPARRMVDLSPPEDQPEHARSLQATIVGPPNAGKSTLLNRLIGEKVCGRDRPGVVPNRSPNPPAHPCDAWPSARYPSSRPRRRRRSAGLPAFGRTGTCRSAPLNQVYLDTPGILPFDQAKGLSRSLVQSAWEALDDAELVVTVLDLVKRTSDVERSLLQQLAKAACPRWLVLNKLDLAGREAAARVDEAIATYKALVPFDRVFVVSAAKGDGVGDLQTALLHAAAPGPWMFSPKLRTDQSDIERAKEAVREQLFRRLNQEVPYAVQLRLVSWADLDDGTTYITMDVYVDRPAQVGIVVGAHGAVIRTVVEKCNEALSKMFGRTVRLSLAVKVAR